MTQRRQRPGALLLCGLWLISPAGGQSSFDWLSQPVYPAQVAMAGAGVAHVGSPEALTQNPAAMGVLGTAGSRSRLWLGGRQYAAGVGQLAATLIFPKGVRTWGLELRSMQYGRFDGYDADGFSTGAYNASETGVRAGVRQSIGRYLAVGGSAGILSGKLEEVGALAVVWSAGFTIHLPAVNAQLGGAIQNDGRYIQPYALEGAASDLPRRWMVGLTKELAYLPLTFHLAAGQAETEKRLFWRVGGEFRLPRAMAFRWGVDQSKNDYITGNANADLLSGISFGLGTLQTEGRWARLALDSAVKLQGPLGITSSFSVNFRL
ncbi:MAG: hypothetical protein IID15_02215 [Candidatus Marinimicrobia bacterium]|nr:hypothetical protein [Candidatus Neomarinimicrobiota bacterium]